MLYKIFLKSSFQSAYKVGHSTETALLCIKNEIHLSLSKGMPTALVPLDLSTAFDTIDDDTLLSGLSARFGFAGSALNGLDPTSRIIFSQSRLVLVFRICSN